MKNIHNFDIIKKNILFLFYFLYIVIGIPTTTIFKKKNQYELGSYYSILYLLYLMIQQKKSSNFKHHKIEKTKVFSYALLVIHWPF